MPKSTEIESLQKVKQNITKKFLHGIAAEYKRNKDGKEFTEPVPAPEDT